MPKNHSAQGTSDRPDSEPDHGLSASEILRMLWRHRLFIAASTFICLACSAAYIKLTKPVYEASAVLRIDPGRAGSLGLNDLGAAGSPDVTDIIHTESAILQSDGVALRTLNSLPDSEFLEFTGMNKDGASLPRQIEFLTSEQQVLLDQLKDDTSAKQEEGTQLLVVSFRHGDPRLAAEILNRLVAAYMVQTFAGRDSSVSQLRTWLSAEMADLKNQVDASQEKLAAFQQQNNIIQTEGTNNTITDRLRLLNDRLAAAQADRIVKEAQLRAAKTSDSEALASLYPNSPLESLERDQATLYTKYSELSAKFGSNYPPLIEIKKQMQATRAQLNSSTQSVLHTLEQEFDAANAVQGMLQAQYNAQAQLAYAFNRNQADYAVLQAEVTSSRELYDTLRRKLQQAGVDAEVNGLDTILVDNARIPSRPVEPRKGIVLVSGFALGLFAGIVSALLFEASSDKLQGIRQISKAMDYPLIGAIPRYSKNGSSARKNLLAVGSSPVMLRSPGSRTAEAYRGLRADILLSSDNGRPNSLLVTSSCDGEGASEVAANYAVALAQAEFRVLIVDADLRSPRLHQEFGVVNGAGLSELLSGGVDRNLPANPIPSLPTLFLLTAGELTSMPSEVLASERLRVALAGWKSQFDYVLFHSAPLLVVSDALPLASWVDGVLLVARYDITRLRDLTEVQRMLKRTAARVIGVLVDDVPDDSDSAYKAYGTRKYA